jgi:hypothetical protein
MSTDITKKFITADPRFDIVEKMVRAILPGAVLVAKYADDAPRAPDIPRPPVTPNSVDGLPVRDAPPPVLIERGAVLDEAVPASVELEFMPPPGLDFDSRHILFGLLEAAEVVDTARAEAWNAFIDEIDAWTESKAGGALPETVVAVELAIRATRAAAQARAEYRIAREGGDAEAIKAAPEAWGVIDLEEHAARLRIKALSVLRIDEATLLAPTVAEPRHPRGNVATPC